MSDLENLAERIRGLSSADQLRLAADLLEARRPNVAWLLIGRILAEARWDDEAKEPA